MSAKANHYDRDLRSKIRETVRLDNCHVCCYFYRFLCFFSVYGKLLLFHHSFILRVGPSSGVSMAAKIPGVHTQKLVKHTTFGHKWWVHELLTDWCHIFWNGIWNLFTFNSLSKHFVALSKNSPFPLSLQWSEKPTWHGTMSDSV